MFKKWLMFVTDIACALIGYWKGGFYHNSHGHEELLLMALLKIDEKMITENCYGFNESE